MSFFQRRKQLIFIVFYKLHECKILLGKLNFEGVFGCLTLRIMQNAEALA